MGRKGRRCVWGKEGEEVCVGKGRGGGFHIKISQPYEISVNHKKVKQN
jgi:hypothetical protein